jgi:predicted anti-sigma-YlaC factor YlaD
MSCEHVKDLLSAYLDNMLAAQEQEMVAQHIQICTDCYAMQEDFRRFDALLAQMPRVSPDPMLRRRIFSSPEYLELSRISGSSYADERSLEATDSLFPPSSFQVFGSEEKRC